MRRYARYFMVCVVAGLLMAGCGASSSKSTDTADNMYQETVTETMAGASAAPALGAMPDVSEEMGVSEHENPQEENDLEETDIKESRKLIKTVDMSVETKQFDAFFSMIEARVEKLGGYIERSDVFGSSYRGGDSRRNASVTARIPIEQVDAFVGGVSKECNVLNKSEYVEDVTLRYTDLESRKKVLSVEQDRLMELLAKAESMDAIVALEQRLSEIRYELESYESQLRVFDNQIAYSTVSMDISEAEVFTPVTEDGFFEQVEKGFRSNLSRLASGLRAFAVWFLSSIPLLLFWGAVIGLIVFVIVKSLKWSDRRAKEKREKSQKKQEFPKYPKLPDENAPKTQTEDTVKSEDKE